MKTAISVPDATFDEATKRARTLGMSRSEFFAIAARRYLDDLDRAGVTEQINQALAEVGADESAAAAAARGRARLDDGNEW